MYIVTVYNGNNVLYPGQYPLVGLTKIHDTFLLVATNTKSPLPQFNFFAEGVLNQKKKMI